MQLYFFNVELLSVSDLTALVDPSDVSQKSVAVSDQQSLRSVIPKISLLLSAQLVGYFFLKAYSNNERDIRINKNEITNIEMRMTAISLLRSDVDVGENKKWVIESLLSEERNFVLAKNERSINESSDDNSILEKLYALVPKKTD